MSESSYESALQRFAEKAWKAKQDKPDPRMILATAEWPLSRWVSTKALATRFGITLAEAYTRLTWQVHLGRVEKRTKGKGSTRVCEWRWKQN